ncbi:hypothetical protein ACLKMY_41510 [Paraburkholderia mimosarum]|uniref:hypothetical protein n=1 Tax=Paraburkholderia mimosarum TaxID=312026 RepID=UPI000AE77D36|nr:hypothetical protein [Paraburkholderia mimosarum]
MTGNALHKSAGDRALALPIGRASEILPTPVAQFIAACWPGMSRSQRLDRARRVALRASLRARPEPDSDGGRLYALILIVGGACCPRAPDRAPPQCSACARVTTTGAGRKTRRVFLITLARVTQVQRNPVDIV